MTRHARTRDRTPASDFSVRLDALGVLHVVFAPAATRALHDALEDLSYFEADEATAIARAMVRVAEAIGPYGVETLVRIGAGDLGEGVAVFEGLPFEAVEWSPYPGSPARSAKSTCLSETVLLGFGAFMGEPYGVASEGSRLVNELIPSRADLDRHTGNGSRKTLGLHAENAAAKFLMSGRDYSPKALMLTGVSEQRVGGPTTPVAIASRAVAMLTEPERRILRRPCVLIRVPERWRGAEGVAEVGPVPVILGAVGREQVVAAFYGDLTRAIDDDSAAALARLSGALDAVAVPLEVIPGRLIHLANGRTLHGRSDFEPEFDGSGRARRWVQRIFLGGRVEDLSKGGDPHERVFDLATATRV